VSDLIGFMYARLDEAEVRAEAAKANWDAGYAWGELPDEVAQHARSHDPARALREIAADREILAGYVAFRRVADAHRDGPGSLGAGVWAVQRELLRVVLLRGTAWADHPDYDEGWKPLPLR
jgi:Family of unknown function (DUF6221)